MKRRTKKIDFNLVRDRKLPILTLDSRWHEMFSEEEKTAAIRELEQKLNDLLAKQGKLVNEIKDLKQLKKKLMADIVSNMEIDNSPIGKAKAKKQEKNKQYILDINEKIDREMDTLSELPYQIKEVNEDLLIETLSICYKRTRKQSNEIKELSEWITKAREELKEKILLKQDLEEKNDLMYSYIHDILGVDLMENLDRKHFLD
ncbi:MAG: hypothetical protein GX359_04365 [Clostridiales bacterium]|nr:hypothetical protein [Clostridiales bacterium]